MDDLTDKVEAIQSCRCHVRSEVTSPEPVPVDASLPSTPSSVLSYATPIVEESDETRVDRAEDDSREESIPIVVPPPRAPEFGHSVSGQRCVRSLGRFDRRRIPYPPSADILSQRRRNQSAVVRRKPGSGHGVGEGDYCHPSSYVYGDEERGS